MGELGGGGLRRGVGRLALGLGHRAAFPDRGAVRTALDLHPHPRADEETLLIVADRHRRADIAAERSVAPDEAAAADADAQGGAMRARIGPRAAIDRDGDDQLGRGDVGRPREAEVRQLARDDVVVGGEFEAVVRDWPSGACRRSGLDGEAARRDRLREMEARDLDGFGGVAAGEREAGTQRQGGGGETESGAARHDHRKPHTKDRAGKAPERSRFRCVTP